MIRVSVDPDIAADAGGSPTPLHPLAAKMRAGPWRAEAKIAVMAIVAWTAVGLFLTVPDLLHGTHWYAVAAKLIETWAWALLTPAILLIDRKLQSVQQNVARLCLVHLLLSIPFTLVHTYLTGLLLYPIPEVSWNPLRNKDFMVYYFTGGWFTYCAFIGALQTFKFYNRYLTSQLELERVEKRLIESRLNALRLQLEPHFLFNALNAISSEAAANPELVEEMIENLAMLLRQSMECQGSTEITLAQELALLDHYLAIQKLRFGKRIDVRVEADPATLSIIVPSLLLQPLVENAIRHGLERRMSGGTIAISAQLIDDHLRIEVVDDGVGLPADWRIENGSGLGLRVTRERLEALYPTTTDRFAICRRDSGGTEVIIHIPVRRAGDEVDGREA
jgi:two-component system, LytTR family, sensor kinase